VRLRLLSRASDLARLQAMLVARAIEARWPDVEVTLLTRVAWGDRDTSTPLAALTEKGAFTADLSNALASGEGDAVVHSWKDLPLEDRAGAGIAATLQRADPRDVLLVRRDAVQACPRQLNVLSSSPRRSWLLAQELPALLPWPIDDVQFLPVRGNIATRLAQLLAPRPRADERLEPHALVVAKAALDRLLGFGGVFDDAARALRTLIDQCAWMVLPIREVPGAPAQGALAVEALRGNAAFERLRAISHQPTWDAVMRERDVLASYGGGCHEALGASVLPRDYGQVVSIRGRSSGGRVDAGWSLIAERAPVPRAEADCIWPRPEERHRASRRTLSVARPEGDAGFWVARAEALPDGWAPTFDRMIWAAGSTTWRRLAARGVWVHGCSDGLGDLESPDVDLLAGRSTSWIRLTHEAAALGDPQALATYVVDETLPEDLPSRSHFFWTSGTQFRQAITQWPVLRDRWHGSGPGRTSRTIAEALGSTRHAAVWLDYEDWKREITT
jgi:hydroxymethylbilane synthase